ncbi:MAG TPA: hypothetical protein DHV36_02720 [Desulfobacteraceae bacterium]|nr:hypothetical protein [Desulfobacteraceae bacterium]
MKHSFSVTRILILLLIPTMLMTIPLSGCDKEVPLSPLEQRLDIYLNNMQASAISLEHALDAIEGARVTNTAKRMRGALQLISKAFYALETADHDVRAYITFVNNNRTAISAQGLNPYLDIREILDLHLTRKRGAIKNYLVHLERWLSYSADNYAKLKAGDLRVRKSYDALLIAVNRKLNQYNRVNDQYQRHTHAFLQRYPQLKKKFKRQYKIMKEEMGWL